MKGLFCIDNITCLFSTSNLKSIQFKWFVQFTCWWMRPSHSLMSYNSIVSVFVTLTPFLAVMSSSRSDSVTHFVRPFVRPFVCVLFLISSFTSIVAKVLYSYLSLSCRLQFAGCMLHDVSCKLQVADCRLQVVGCRLQFTRCRLHVARCMLDVARCKFQASGCRLHDAGYRLQVKG